MKVRTPDGIAELPFLAADTDRHGTLRFYVRRKGRPKVRIRAAPGTEAFMVEYRAARDGGAPVPAPAPGTGTLRWLATLWFRSAEFARLAEPTRVNRRRVLDPVLVAHGHRLADQMQARHVRAIVAEKTAPEASNQRLKALRALCAWAVTAGHLEVNPARDVLPIRTGSEGWHTMTPDEMAAYVARHPPGTKAYLAFALLVFTGVRRSDLVRLGRQMERDGLLWIRETKGSARKAKVTTVPIHPGLRAAIDAGPTGDLTYLVTDYGRPFSVAGFGNWFRARCDEAGLGHCSAHSVRKGVATLLAEGGATEHELMAGFGWTTPQQAAGYTRKVNRQRLARAAWQHLSVPLPGGECPTPIENDDISRS